MDFVEIIKQTRGILQSEGRITYRALKRQFELDDEALEDLKFELIEGQAIAADKDGKMLVWTGSLASSVHSLESEKQRPILIGQTLDPRLSDPRRQPPAPNPQFPNSGSLKGLTRKICKRRKHYWTSWRRRLLRTAYIDSLKRRTIWCRE